jgi:hypothetical protein
MLIGFSAEEESRRARQFTCQNGKNVRICLPLWDAGLCRHAIVELIKRHGQRVPIKSGCTFCPFSKRSHWDRLYARHPHLFWMAVAMEENGQGWSRGIGLSHKPLRELVKTKPRVMKAKPCVCGRPKNEPELYWGSFAAGV